MRYPEQSLTENEERQKGERERERKLKGWIYIAIKRKEWCARGRRAVSRIYIYILCKSEREKGKSERLKAEGEMKGNGRISHSSTYGRVVSQSHCYATPQEYEWAKSSPHFIIFFRLCVSEMKQDGEQRGEERDKSRATISCLRKPWLKIPIPLVQEWNFYTSGNYLRAIPRIIIEKFVKDMFCLTVRVLY